MEEKNQLSSNIGESIEYAREYLRQQGELLRLEAAERSSKTTAALITGIVLTGLLLLVILILSIATGFWLGNLWGSYSKAFFAIAGFYALVAGLIYLFRKPLITTPVLNITIKAFFDRKKEE